MKREKKQQSYLNETPNTSSGRDPGYDRSRILSGTRPLNKTAHLQQWHMSAGPNIKDRRTAQRACYTCGDLTHWAKNCPRGSGKVGGHVININTYRSKVSTQNLRTQIEPKKVISGDSSQS